MRVFIDSDVVISSLLSQSGAAHLLLKTTDTTRFISTISLKELRVVCKRLHISQIKLETLVRKGLTILQLEEKIHTHYEQYVTDANDAHIVAGAVKAKTTYLISYNLKHFKKDAIKDTLGILLMTPAMFLQFLRSH